MAVDISGGNALTEERIKAAERLLDCQLPEAYRNFVREHDGAKPASNVIDVPGNRTGVRSFIALDDAPKLRTQIEGFPPNAVPIADDDCGNYFWLNPEMGDVFFWDHEVENPSAQVAPTFDSFLDRMSPFDTTSVVLEPGQVRRVWVRPGFNPKFS